MPVRNAAIAVAVAVVAISAPAMGLATPFTGQGKTGPLHWKNGTTIHVYIPAGPHFNDLKAGVEAWNSDPSLQSKNIHIDVKQGAAPTDPADPSQPASGNVSLNLHAGNPPAGGDSGTGGANFNGAQISSGKIDIYEGELTTGSFAKKIATHEMGHVLGLNDSTKPGEIMLHEIADDGSGITMDDNAELRSGYLADATDSHVDLTANVTPVGNLWRYDYDASWLSGAPLAVFQLMLAGNTHVISAQAPDGWKIDDYSVPSDAFLNPSGPSRAMFGFILADETSYLGPNKPELRFSILADQHPGDGQAFLNGLVSTIAPVPESGTWALLLVGFGLVGAALRTVRKRSRLPMPRLLDGTGRRLRSQRPQSLQSVLR